MREGTARGSTEKRFRPVGRTSLRPRLGDPAGPGATFVEEVVTFDAPNLFGYAARAGVPIPGYQGEVRLTPEGEGTRIDYTVSSTSSFPLLKPVLIGQGQLLMRLFARAAAK